MRITTLFGRFTSLGFPILTPSAPNNLDFGHPQHLVAAMEEKHVVLDARALGRGQGAAPSALPDWALKIVATGEKETRHAPPSMSTAGRNTWKASGYRISESLPCVSRRNDGTTERIRSALRRAILMLMTRERRLAIRTLRGWVISVLQEAGAIRECEEHGWMQDRADPHARERALVAAQRDPPADISPDDAVAAVADVLTSIGDTCPECSSDIE